MSDEKMPLSAAIAEELEKTHQLPQDEAAAEAVVMAEALQPRFSTWVRRELVIRRKVRRAEERRKPQAAAAVAEEEFERLSLNVRVQHGIMAASCLLLIATGIPLKYHSNPIARAVLSVFGGVEYSPLVHRGAATALAFVGIWHLLYTLFTVEGRRDFMRLLPMPKDALDAWKQIKYYLGRAGGRPKFDRFSYVEKFDYWAVYWGMVIMIGSGGVLWFTNFFLRFVPKWVTDIAKEAHSDEALLATLAIIIWHFYNVHLNPHKFPMNMTFINGKISAKEMAEEHPLEYERILAGRKAPPAHQERTESAGGEP